MCKRCSLQVILSLLAFAVLMRGGGVVYAARQEKDVQEIEKLLKTRISSVTKSDRLTSEVPTSVTIITAEEIERYGFRSLDEVFLIVSGFYTTNDRNYAYLGTRGFSRPSDYNDRIRLLIDGHSLNESMYGQVPVGTDLAIDLGAIDRIEISRGPHSALYGTGAMFSVINLVTKKGNDVNGARLLLEAGSPGRMRASVLAGKRFKGGMDIFFSAQGTDEKGEDLYFKEYDDSAANSGMVSELDWDRNAGFQLRVSKGRFIAQGVLFAREKGMPTGAWDVKFNDSRAKTLDQYAFLDVRYDHDFSADKNLLVRAYYNRFNYKGEYPYELVMHERTTSIWAGGEIQFRWDLGPSHRFIAGAEYQDHGRVDLKSWDDRNVFFNGNFPFQVVSFYIQDEFQVRPNLALTFGLRRDDYSKTGGETTPRLALVYHPFESSTLKLIYGEAFRAPNPYELNYSDDIVGFKPNPSLKPERIQTAEFIWEQRLGKNFYTTLNLFDDRLKNLIDQKADPAGSLIQFQNIGRVHASGLEMEIQGRWKSGLWAQASYTYQHAEDEETEAKLTNSPSQLIKAGFSAPLFNYVMVSALGTYESGRETVYGTKTNPYLLINACISSTHLFDRLRLSIVIKNLLNTKYHLPGGFEHRQPAIIQPSRSLAVKIEWTL